MTNRKRTLIAKGVYRDRFGVAIIVSIQGKPREFRQNEKHDAYDSFSKAQLISERIRIQAREQLKVERQSAKGDTFAADVERFLNTLTGGHKVNMRGYMAHWESAFRDARRNEITDVDAQTAYAAIDKADSTKRHLRRALIKFYEALNGVSGYNPARSLSAPPKPKTEARAIPYPVIEQIFKALTKSRAKARLMVMAYTGLPQGQIAKLHPSDLRLGAKEVIVRPRRKGAGVEGRALPLSAAGVAALKEFKELDAFGSFQKQQLVDTFRLGAKRAKVTLPENARPYDLRHSFLTELYRQTGDIYAVSELAMHSTLDQTARYAKGAVSERATKALASVPRFRATKTVPKGAIHATSVSRNRGKMKPSRTGPTSGKRSLSRGKL